MMIKVDNINNYNDNDYKLFYEKISNDKKNKIKKYNNLKRKQSILGEILLISIFNNYGIDYDNLKFNYNKYGKPLIDDYYFNISHSYDYVTCVLTKSEVGIDIEKIRHVDLKISRMFTNNVLNNLNQFYIIYTLKEAYIKCIGESIINIGYLDINLSYYKFITMSDGKYRISLCIKKGE